MPLMETLYNGERAKNLSLIPFFYSADFQAGVAAGGTTQTNTGIQSDSHFVTRYFTITAYTTAAPNSVVAVATPPLLIQVFDTSSGRTLFDSPQPIQNVMGGVAAAAGTGSLPFILPEPWLVRAGGSIQTTIQNLGATTFTRVFVSFSGMKVFQFGSSVPGNI